MRGKSVDKKIKNQPVKVTPVILIDDSEQLSNTVIISKMINSTENPTTSILKPTGALGGGYKYRPEQQNAKSNNSSNFLNIVKNKLDKQTVYDEFGIINDSIGKKKYRQIPQQLQQNEPEVRNIKVISSNNPWKKQNNEPLANNYMDSGYYNLIKSKERQQSAVHVKSSLEVINLDNVEARLEAHRQSMKPIQQQYNIMKGKSNLQQIQNPYSNMRFNIDVDKEYEAMQPQRIYQLIKDKQNQLDRPQEDIVMQELWEEKKRLNPKLAQYDFKYQQFLVQKQAKKMIGSIVKDNLFSWDKYAKKQDLQKRKVAKQHKSKEKGYGEIVQKKVLSKGGIQSPEKDRQNQSLQKNNKSTLQDRIASKDDKFIGKYIMSQIDSDKRGTISKDELIDYLSKKEHLIKGYHIDLKWLHTDLDNFQTKRKGMLNQGEIVQFLATLDSLHHPQMILKQISKDKNKNSDILGEIQAKDNKKLYVSYFKQHCSKFQRIFTILDISDDRLIKREQFLQNIFIDTECNKIIDRPVLKFNIIGKTITFRQILTFILNDYQKEKNQKLKKSKQYITFQRFKQYFQIPQSLDINSLERSNSQKLKNQKQSHQIQIFDIQQQYLQLLKDICSTIPRIYQDYIVSNDFIAQAMKDPQILALSEQMCRIQSVETNLPVETIKSTLMRMMKECDQYSTWDALKSYFSRRGRPLDWDYDFIQKKKQIRQERFKDKANQVKRNTSAVEDKDLLQNKNIFELSGKKKGNNNKSIQKYTIPQPFKITDQLKKKEQLNLLSSQQKQIQQLKKKFKAKPLNKQIFEPKPDLIQGKLNKSLQKNQSYNYQNYENDRIERVLKKAQEQFQLAEQMKQIKKLAEVKAKDVKIDLTKKLEDVIGEHKKKIEKERPKPTVPKIGNNLYPDNPKDLEKKKLENYKKTLQKQKEAEQTKLKMKQEIKDNAKKKNDSAVQKLKKAKQQQERKAKQLAELDPDPYKPSINKYNISEQQKQAMKKAKQERKRLKQEQILDKLQKNKQKKDKILNYQKKEKKLDIEGLDDEEILSKLDEVDFLDLLLDVEDQQIWNRQYNFKDKTRKQIKQRFSGLAGRERAMMEAQEKRMQEQKIKLKQQKQGKIIKQKIQSAKQLKEKANGTMNMDTNFNRSNALRRYRAIMQGKVPQQQFDKYSRIAEPVKQEI